VSWCGDGVNNGFYEDTLKPATSLKSMSEN